MKVENIKLGSTAIIKLVDEHSKKLAKGKDKAFSKDLIGEVGSVVSQNLGFLFNDYSLTYTFSEDELKDKDKLPQLVEDIKKELTEKLNKKVKSIVFDTYTIFKIKNKVKEREIESSMSVANDYMKACVVTSKSQFEELYSTDLFTTTIKDEKTYGVKNNITGEEFNVPVIGYTIKLEEDKVRIYLL